MFRTHLVKALIFPILSSLLLSSLPATAAAAELKILSAGAVTEVMSHLARDFQAETGHTVKFTFEPVGTILSLMSKGETGDIIVLTNKAIDDLVKKNLITPQSVMEIGKVGIGIAVREGALLPDISTTDALRQTLLNADSIVYADPAKGASSGIYFAGLLDRLRIAEAVKGKTFLRPGGYVVELVAEGKAEIGVHQVTEILPVKGVTLVGPLPPEVQNITTYAAGISTTAKQPEVAKQFLRFVARPENAPLFKELGFGYY